jgi:hypothetical protein
MSNHKKALSNSQIITREPDTIYQIQGEIVNGTF